MLLQRGVDKMAFIPGPPPSHRPTLFTTLTPVLTLTLNLNLISNPNPNTLYRGSAYITTLTHIVPTPFGFELHPAHRVALTLTMSQTPLY